MQLKRALVTGGAGFIGSHLSEALVSNGIRVTILDNLISGSLSNIASIRSQVTFIEGDIRNLEIVEQSVAKQDVIFHLAAQVSVTQSVENPVESATVNDIGTLNVLETARKHHVKRVVLSSSCAVYGDDPQLPKTEDMVPKPMSPYAIQKLIGEYYAQLYYDLHGLETVSLRYFNVYGPRQDPSSPYSGVISLFLTRAISKEPPIIYGDGFQYRDFIFVKDVVDANLLAARVDGLKSSPFNVGTGTVVNINSLWEKISGLSGWQKKPRYEAARPGDIRESVAGIDLAGKTLGFKPGYTIEKGLDLTFKWYQTNCYGK